MTKFHIPLDAKFCAHALTAFGDFRATRWNWAYKRKWHAFPDQAPLTAPHGKIYNDKVHTKLAIGAIRVAKHNRTAQKSSLCIFESFTKSSISLPVMSFLSTLSSSQCWIAWSREIQTQMMQTQVQCPAVPSLAGR